MTIPNAHMSEALVQITSQVEPSRKPTSSYAIQCAVPFNLSNPEVTKAGCELYKTRDCPKSVSFGTPELSIKTLSCIRVFVKRGGSSSSMHLPLSDLHERFHYRVGTSARWLSQGPTERSLQFIHQLLRLKDVFAHNCQ